MPEAALAWKLHLLLCGMAAGVLDFSGVLLLLPSLRSSGSFDV